MVVQFNLGPDCHGSIITVQFIIDPAEVEQSAVFQHINSSYILYRTLSLKGDTLCPFSTNLNSSHFPGVLKICKQIESELHYYQTKQFINPHGFQPRRPENYRFSFVDSHILEPEVARAHDQLEV